MRYAVRSEGALMAPGECVHNDDPNVWLLAIACSRIGCDQPEGSSVAATWHSDAISSQLLVVNALPVHIASQHAPVTTLRRPATLRTASVDWREVPADCARLQLPPRPEHTRLHPHRSTSGGQISAGDAPAGATGGAVVARWRRRGRGLSHGPGPPRWQRSGRSDDMAGA